MVYGCGNKCVKYLVFAFNFLVCVVGATILAVSLTVAFSNSVKTYMQKILDQNDAGINIDQMNIFLYVLAGVGGFLFLTGFLGCCGACCENVWMLGLFFIIILILFLIELGSGIAILIKKNEFKESLEVAMSKQMSKYNDLAPDVQAAIDQMQEELNCCGCRNATDYHTPNPPCSDATAVGCCVKIWNNMEQHIGIVSGVAIGILVVELLAMVFSCILCQAFRRGDYRTP